MSFYIATSSPRLSGPPLKHCEAIFATQSIIEAMSTAVHVEPKPRFSTEVGVVIATNSDNPPSTELPDPEPIKVPASPRENGPEKRDLYDPDSGDALSIK